MLEKIGGTLVASAITNDKKWQRQLTDATNIDRLNIGPIPTTKLDWLQPHEGNIVDFLFRARAFQIPQERLAGKTWNSRLAPERIPLLPFAFCHPLSRLA